MKTKTNKTATATATIKFNLEAFQLNARQTAGVFETTAELLAEKLAKAAKKERVVVASIPPRFTDAVVIDQIKAADAIFASAEAAKKAIQSSQIEAVLVWKKLGFTKQESYARAKVLVMKMGCSEKHAGSVASHSCKAAGYPVDEVKSKARGARTAKAKEKAKSESQPLAEALKEYALNAVKTKAKAKAALLAAAALIK